MIADYIHTKDGQILFTNVKEGTVIRYENKNTK